VLFRSHGGPGNVMMLWYYGFLSRGYLQSTMALHADTFKLGDDTHAHPLAQPVAGLLGIIAMVLVCHYIVLRACYTHGYNSMYGTPLSMGTDAANTVAAAIEQPTTPDVTRAAMGLVGAIVTTLLILARRVWLRFPLHPLAYAMGTAYGEILWGPFLMAGVVKSVVLRLGGVGSYRRTQALFLGLVLGHGFFGGVLNSLLQIYNSELFRRYLVAFG
jgi:hypothetical protein